MPRVKITAPPSPREPRPRVAHVPTPETQAIVEALVACGVRQEAIAHEIGLGVDALRKHYADQLAYGLERASGQVGNRLLDIALHEKDLRAALPACIFWLKTRAGWRETLHVNHSTEPEKVITDEATPEEWENEWADKSAASQAH